MKLTVNFTSILVIHGVGVIHVIQKLGFGGADKFVSTIITHNRTENRICEKKYQRTGPETATRLESVLEPDPELQENCSQF